MIALDASALLAYLFKEIGHEQVVQYINDCCLSTVNLSEVIGRFARDGHDPQMVTADQAWQQTSFGLQIVVIR